MHKIQLASVQCVLNWNISVTSYNYLTSACVTTAKVKVVFLSRQQYKHANLCHNQKTPCEI